MKRVIIDTDPGQDDAMALMLMLKSSFKVEAITTVAGNSVIENTTANARYVLGLISNEKTPIYSGASKPMKRKLIQAVVHGQSGLEGIDHNIAPNLTSDAVDKILELVKKNPNKLTILTLGPLTNIAVAIARNPEVMIKVKELVIMGGAFTVPGNKNRVAEFNIFVDPEAASIVTNFPVPKTFVPLDACNGIQLDLVEFEKVKNLKVKKALIDMNIPYIRNLKADMAASGALMYDVLAAYYLLERNKCQVYSANVQIETEGSITRGMTVIDRRPVTDNLAPNAKIVKNIPEIRFKKVFFDSLNGGIK